jgi:general secretion pathway protein D
MLAVMVLLAACTSSTVKQADEYASQDEWLKAVLEYRKGLAGAPADIEYRSRLRQTELKAADFYYQRGQRMLEQGALDEAVVQFQQGLAALPDHRKLQQAMTDALARKEAGNLYVEGLSLHQAGKLDDARRQFQRTLDVFPDHKDAAAALAELKKQDDERQSEGLALSSKARITLNPADRPCSPSSWRNRSGQHYFRQNVKSAWVTLFAKTSRSSRNEPVAHDLKSFCKKIGGNTILIARPKGEARYEDLSVRTFHMNTVRAKEMADILKGLVTVKKIIVNDQLNTIVVRDTEDVIKLTERIIETNDRKPAEMILEVEILEVNRSKAEKLGLDFGTYSTTVLVPLPSTVPLEGARAAIRAAAVISVPPITFRFFKQDVDAKILANPKIRVLNGRAAKIHIGDRVPLRAATIVDATGQTRTTFDYKDIGIRLLVEPTIYLDNSAMVKLGLEVSALGENLGTVNDPAFKIGTKRRDLHAASRRRDAILSGLIRTERNTKVKSRVSATYPRSAPCSPRTTPRPTAPTCCSPSRRAWCAGGTCRTAPHGSLLGQRERLQRQAAVRESGNRRGRADPDRAGTALAAAAPAYSFRRRWRAPPPSSPP